MKTKYNSIITHVMKYNLETLDGLLLKARIKR